MPNTYTQSDREQAARVLEVLIPHVPKVTGWTKECKATGAMKAALDTAISVLRSQGWVRTAERLPTEADDGEYGVVLAYNKALASEDEMGLAACVRAWVVREGPEWWTYWMRLPALPAMPEVEL